MYWEGNAVGLKLHEVSVNKHRNSEEQNLTWEWRNTMYVVHDSW